jgi:hypothetical protein
MKDFIRKLIREQMIDGQNMNQGTQTACNTMSVATYKEGLQLIINAIGSPEQNPKLWNRISKPLHNWQQADIEIGKEVKIDGMSGDSMVDESNTWWAAIQSTICEQGSDGLTESIKPMKNVNQEFDKIKSSWFNTLKPLTIEQMVKNWSEVSEIRNDNIDTIKYFINKFQKKEKVECITYDEKGLEDGYHRLIASKILNIEKICYKSLDIY